MRRLPVPLLPSRLRWGGVVLVGAAIAALSLTTVPPQKPVLLDGPLLDIAVDKWRHLVAYAVFGGTLAYATADWNWPGTPLAALVIGVAVAYGLGIEGIQALLPYRYFGLGDAAANAVGSLLVLPWFLCRPWVRLVPVPTVETRG